MARQHKLNRSARLQRDGIGATATVLEVKDPWLNVVVKDVYVKRKLRIRIDRDDRVPDYDTTYSALFRLGAVPEVGDTIRVVVDPRRRRRVAVAEDTETPAAPEPLPGLTGRRTWRFTSWGGGAAGTRSAPRRDSAPPE